MTGKWTGQKLTGITNVNEGGEYQKIAEITSDSLHGSIQVVESIALHYNSCNFRSNATLWPTFLNTNTSAGLFNGVDNGLTVKWTESAAK